MPERWYTPPCRPVRNDVFLEKELDRIGEWLHEAARSDTIGTEPILETRQQTPLEQRQIGEGGRRDQEDQQRLDHGDQQTESVLPLFSASHLFDAEPASLRQSGSRASGIAREIRYQCRSWHRVAYDPRPEFESHQRST